MFPPCRQTNRPASIRGVVASPPRFPRAGFAGPVPQSIDPPGLDAAVLEIPTEPLGDDRDPLGTACEPELRPANCRCHSIPACDAALSCREAHQVLEDQSVGDPVDRRRRARERPACEARTGAHDDVRTLPKMDGGEPTSEERRLIQRPLCGRLTSRDEVGAAPDDDALTDLGLAEAPVRRRAPFPIVRERGRDNDRVASVAQVLCEPRQVGRGSRSLRPVVRGRDQDAEALHPCPRATLRRDPAPHAACWVSPSRSDTLYGDSGDDLRGPHTVR